MGPGPERKRVLDGLTALSTDAANLDIKPLTGASPWRRLRIGDYRILYWEPSPERYEVRRIIHRRDLESSVADLPTFDV